MNTHLRAARRGLRSFRPSIRFVLWTCWTLVVAVTVSTAGNAVAEDPLPEFWTANNGPGVANVLRVGNSVYFNGAFTHVGPATGSWAALDVGTGVPQLPYLGLVGTVYDAVPDGTGGWFIGGSFTSVRSQPRSNVAHILADGTVGSWNPGANSSVRALALSGGTLYVGGDFTTIGGQSRSRIAAVEAATGIVSAWNPSALGTVYSLLVSGGFVYAGGSFTSIGGGHSPRIAVLDAATGTLAPTLLQTPDQQVLSLVLSGTTLYASGDFTLVGQGTGSWASLDVGTGVAQTPFAGVNGPVAAAVPDGAGGWYIGGSFTSVRGQSRSGLARILADGSLASWNPSPSPASVSALAISGGTVYAGGGFTSIGGQTRNRIAAVDGATGLASSWDPNANGIVSTLALAGGTVYAGGTFTTIGGQTRNRIAALDATTGLATSWNPNAGNSVSMLAVSGNTVYAAGTFTTIGGQTRNRVAALDTAGVGLATAWNPNANGNVSALALSGSTIYAGGTFTTIGGQTRNFIAELDTAGAGLATGWNPNSNAPVLAFAVSGSTVYAGGTFATIGGQTRNRLAELDRTSGLATTWSPNPGGGANQVNVVAVSGGVVAAGGSFTMIGAQTRTRVASLDVETGLLTPWNPNSNGTVNRLAVSGGTVYAVGPFSSIGGQTRNGLAALDPSTGLATAWNPNIGAGRSALAVSGGVVYASRSRSDGLDEVVAVDASNSAIVWTALCGSQMNMLAASGGSVWAGGSFSSIGGVPRPQIGALDATTGEATAWNPTFNLTTAVGSNYALAASPDGATLYVMGPFTSVNGQSRNNRMAAFDVATGSLTSWQPAAPVNLTTGVLVTSGASVYACGGNFVRAFDAATGALRWTVTGTVSDSYHCMDVGNGKLYVGGIFPSIGGIARNNIAALDTATGAVAPWNPNATGGSVNAVKVDESLVYVGGNFTSIGGQARNRIAAVDATTALANEWNPNVNSGVMTLLVRNGMVYAGGFFSLIGGQSRIRLAEIDGTSGAATSFAPSFDPFSSHVRSMSLSGGRLFTTGAFTTVGGVSRNNIAVFNDPTLVGVDAVPSLPDFSLAPNVPNPFNRSSRIRFSLPKAGPVRLTLYDLAGREVRRLLDEPRLEAGQHDALVSADRLKAGVYWYRLEWNGHARSARLVVMP